MLDFKDLIELCLMIFFRTDANLNIGFGHLLRCVNLAVFLIKKGYKCQFLLKENNLSANNILDVNSISYRLIENEVDVLKINHIKNRLLIYDINNSCLFKNNYEYLNCINFLADKGLKIVSFDDIKKKLPNSQLSIIPYFGSENIIFNKKKSTRLLLGSKYFIYGDPFLKAERVQINNKVKKIFICMGGSDPDKILEMILYFLIESKKKLLLNIVILKLDKNREDSIKVMLKKYNGEYKININPKNITSIINKSDIGIINSGMIKYETSILGLPCLSLSNNLKDEFLMNFFKNKRLLLHLGYYKKLNFNIFNENLNKIIDFNLRNKMHKNLINFFDGRGINRVFDEIINIKL